MGRLVSTTDHLSSELGAKIFIFHRWEATPDDGENIRVEGRQAMVEDRKTGRIYRLDPSLIRFLSAAETMAIFQREEAETDRLVDQITQRYLATRTPV